MLLVGNFLSSSTGTAGICEQLERKLQDRGWVVISTSRETKRGLRLADMLSTAWHKRKHYEIAQIDVYSGLAFFWAEAVCLLLQRLRKPYMLTLHGGNLPAFARRWPGRVRHLLSPATAVTTPSLYLQKELSALRQDILLVPNALDFSSYPFVQRTFAEPRIAWLRAFHRIYNPGMAVETIYRLVNDFPSLKLDMVGPDKNDGTFEEAQRLVAKYGLHANISFSGKVAKAEVPKKLSSYDVFLNTTTAESFGVSVMEAAALGMCIVTTNVGELPYIWTHGHDALLVPPDDAPAMAHAVRRILTEPELAERLSRNARAKAEQYDWSVVLPQWEALLDSVISHNHA